MLLHLEKKRRIYKKSIFRLGKIYKKSISPTPSIEYQISFFFFKKTETHSNPIIERNTQAKRWGFPSSFNWKVESNQNTINWKKMIAKRVIQSEGPLKEKSQFWAWDLGKWNRQKIDFNTRKKRQKIDFSDTLNWVSNTNIFPIKAGLPFKHYHWKNLIVKRVLESKGKFPIPSHARKKLKSRKNRFWDYEKSTKIDFVRARQNNYRKTIKVKKARNDLWGENCFCDKAFLFLKSNFVWEQMNTICQTQTPIIFVQWKAKASWKVKKSTSKSHLETI